MIINETTFNVDCMTILKELQQQLNINKIHLLQVIQDSSEDVMIACPYHKDGQESRPSMGVRKHDGLCHCFRGDTHVLTLQGSKAIKDILNVPVSVLNGRGEWEVTTFRKYGEDVLWRINLSQDKQHKDIYATSSHEWFVHGKNKLYCTSDLVVGDYLESVIPKQVSEGYSFDKEGFIHGVIYGDGARFNRYKQYGSGKNRITDRTQITKCLYGIRIPKFTKKAKLIKYFDNSTWTIRDDAVNGKEYFKIVSKTFPKEHNYKQPPSLEMPVDYLMSFLSGYFACDGSFDLNNISCSDLDKLIKVRDICIHCGVGVRDIKEVSHSTNYLEDAKLYILPILRESLPDAFYVIEDVIPRRKYCRTRWKIESVVRTVLSEDVYCCETSTHSFVLDGNILTHNCFACNSVVTLPQLISHCFGDDGEIGATGWNWLLKNFLTVSVEERKDIELDFSRNNSRDRDADVLHHRDSIRGGSGNDAGFVSEEELDSYRWVHPYWAKRKITDERIIELFDLGYDPESKCITMPVRDIKGNCLFVARRSVNSKWFNYPKSSIKPVFGLYELAQQPKYPNEVLICESMIDAITVWQYGKYAVALNGLGTAYQFKQLRQMPCRKFILATDADGPGMAARANIKRNVPNKLITEYIWDLTIAKDINDMTEEYFNSLKDTL